ncbi:MAG TPA: amino acid ABC transporter permease [Clostridiales bacterium UBA8960]|nr:amino acid ABC transporter permease [Clostridiales bacterium UBA8960]
MKKLASFLIAFGLYVLLFYFVSTNALEKSVDFSVYEQYYKVILNGWLTTLTISAVSLVLALFVGLLLYMMHQSRFKVLYYLSEIHKTIIFGTPLVVIAIIAYYYIGNAFGIRSKFWIGVFTLALYIGAYIADIYKGAIESIHINQWQTAKMFGFTKYQTYRYIVFPQVITTVLPPLAGQFAMTIKSSALLAYMATDEFLNSIQTVMSISFRIPEGLMVVTIGYLILTIPLILLVRYLENKLNYKVDHEFKN